MGRVYRLRLLFAVFPFLIWLTALAGFAGRPEMVDEIVALAFEALPAEVVETLAPVIAEVLMERRATSSRPA